MFPKVVITKIVIKKHSRNRNILETFQNDNQNKVKPFENSFLYFGKFADSRDNVSEESFSKNNLGVCFIKYMISLSAVGRLKNLEAKIPYIKKYESKPWKTLKSYANADLKICQYLRRHMKIICRRFHIKTPFTFWNMCTYICEKFEKFTNFKGK